MLFYIYSIFTHSLKHFIKSDRCIDVLNDIFSLSCQRIFLSICQTAVDEHCIEQRAELINTLKIIYWQRESLAFTWDRTYDKGMGGGVSFLQFSSILLWQSCRGKFLVFIVRTQSQTSSRVDTAEVRFTPLLGTSWLQSILSMKWKCTLLRSVEIQQTFIHILHDSHVYILQELKRNWTFHELFIFFI